LHAAAPALLGAPFAELVGMLGFEKPADLDRAYAAHAASVRGRRLKDAIAMPSLFDLEGGGGDVAQLKAGLAALARRRSDGTSADELLLSLTSSVEQTSALACNMLAAAHLHEKGAASLPAEQAAVLKGVPPDAPITPELLDAMPMLDAFARETMRLYPPSRPGRVALSAPLTLPRTPPLPPVELPAGTILAPEPFVAHYHKANVGAAPSTFRPERWVADSATDAPPVLLPFGTAGGDDAVGMLGAGSEGAAGARLAVSMAKAIYVQVRRMFDETLIGASPPPTPYGRPLHTVGERVEVLYKPKMYYELQRGVKQLRF